MGIVIYLVGKTNVLIGAMISFPNQTSNYDVFIYTAYAVTIFWRIVLELLYQTRSKVMFFLLNLQGPKSSGNKVRPRNL